MNFNCCKTKVSKDNLVQTAQFLKIIAEPNRLKILCILQKKDLCVCEIWQNLNLPQNLISHHLKVLKNFKLITSKKEGTKVVYSLHSKIMKKYFSLLSHYINK